MWNLISKKICGRNNEKTPNKNNISRSELERKAVEGARKATKDYRKVFERLAEYDKS